MNSALIALVLLVTVLCSCSATPPPAGTFECEMECEVEGQAYSYLLEVPDAAGRPAKGWPVLLFLHGAGERGDDLELVRFHGPLKLMAEVPQLTRCVLVGPQCPADQWWQPSTLGSLLDEVLARTDVDLDRVYVTGLSMGGYATWGLLSSFPERFAAAVPICGGGQSSRLWPDLHSEFSMEGLLEARGVPVRAFHGDADPVIPVEESRLLVDALQAAGGDAELTIYAGVGHDSWTSTYADPGLYAWLFAQSR
jgi:predicted peptidase